MSDWQTDRQANQLASGMCRYAIGGPFKPRSMHPACSSIAGLQCQRCSAHNDTSLLFARSTVGVRLASLCKMLVRMM
jgi:hypothetical protein